MNPVGRVPLRSHSLSRSLVSEVRRDKLSGIVPERLLRPNPRYVSADKLESSDGIVPLIVLSSSKSLSRSRVSCDKAAGTVPEILLT